MTYMKLVTVGVKHHLAAAEQPLADSITLCGCVVTQRHSWRRVMGLEGDECPHCAALAFGGSEYSRGANPSKRTAYRHPIAASVESDSLT